MGRFGFGKKDEEAKNPYAKSGGNDPYATPMTGKYDELPTLLLV